MWVSPEWQLGLCGFCGAKSTAKKTRGLFSLQWDEFKGIRCNQGELFQQSANQALMTVFEANSAGAFMADGDLCQFNE